MEEMDPDRKPAYKDWRDIPLTPVCNYSTLHGNLTGGWRTFRPIIDLEKCTSCGLCWRNCPDTSILWVEDHPEVRYTHCKGCGICANECPVDAIEMELEVKV
jgi:2-oxoacid:acceptor oxidoreductase delta subunit (pyruvate/2-ketoisovalerate family)